MTEGPDKWLVKLVLIGVVAGIYAIARTQRRTSEVSSDTFRYHPLLAALVACASAALLWAGDDALGNVTDPDTRPAVLAMFGLAAGVTAILAAYLARYRVRIDATTIEYGAFTRSAVPLAEIVDCDLGSGDRADLLLFHRDGQRTSIPSLLGEFDVLAATVTAHCEQLARAGGANPSRILAERARRKRRRLIGWGVLAAIVLLVVAVTVIGRG
jgi:hypothetical protein